MVFSEGLQSKGIQNLAEFFLSSEESLESHAHSGYEGSGREVVFMK